MCSPTYRVRVVPVELVAQDGLQVVLQLLLPLLYLVLGKTRQGIKDRKGYNFYAS